MLGGVLRGLGRLLGRKARRRSGPSAAEEEWRVQQELERLDRARSSPDVTQAEFQQRVGRHWW